MRNTIVKHCGELTKILLVGSSDIKIDLREKVVNIGETSDKSGDLIENKKRIIKVTIKSESDIQGNAIDKISTYCKRQKLDWILSGSSIIITKTWVDE
jgi:hypothetical protein